MSVAKSSSVWRSDAQKIAQTVDACVQWAVEVDRGRRDNPASFPLVPPDAGSAYWTRKLLGHLVEAGFAPEGWERDFMDWS